jgi:hypothetical protein
MNFLTLTQLNLTVNGNVQERKIYVNPQHIKQFTDGYAENFKMDLTCISSAIGGHNPIYVKETPEEILNQLNN